MKKHASIRLLVLLLVYLAVALPFKVMEIIPGFADIRPVTMLGPIYGVFFGPLGCLAFAIGNLLADILSDSLRWSSIAGFAANFCGPFLIYWYWTHISKKAFSLDTMRAIGTHVLVVILAAILEAALITPMVALAYPDVDAQLFALSVVVNTSAFPILFGIPLAILLQTELGFRPIPPRERPSPAADKD
ncbi:MAG: QueT transporter family protein [Firmicutes bacterium]|nr:QueT transporter family protein [Bacillota bacterium]